MSVLLVPIEFLDAAALGPTLRSLARVNKSPDLTVAQRLDRVGKAINQAVEDAKKAGVFR